MESVKNITDKYKVLTFPNNRKELHESNKKTALCRNGVFLIFRFSFISKRNSKSTINSLRNALSHYPN